MATLTQIKEVLDAPRKAQQALRASTTRRLQTLEYAELEVARRARECDVRDAVFRRAVDAGPGRLSEEQLRKWVEKELLPSLPAPTSIVRLTGELEERAAELDAALIELQERELVLRHERETLLLKSSEVSVREEEVERRVRVSAEMARKVELEIDSRSQAYSASRNAWNVDSTEHKLRHLFTEERADRGELKAQWYEWCLAAGRDADRLKRSHDASQRSMKTAKQVLSKWKSIKSPVQPQGLEFEINMSPAPQSREYLGIESTDVPIFAEAETQCALPKLITANQATQTRRLAPEVPQTDFEPHSTNAQRSLIEHHTPSSAWSTQPPVYSRDPSIVVLPAYDTEGDMFDAMEEETLQRQQVEISRDEGLHREMTSRLAARETELSALREYLVAQRASVDEMSAHLLMRLEKLVEAEIKLRGREDALKERGSVAERPPSDNNSSDDDSSRATAASDRHISVHPLFNFTRVDPIHRRTAAMIDSGER